MLTDDGHLARRCSCHKRRPKLVPRARIGIKQDGLSQVLSYGDGKQHIAYRKNVWWYSCDGIHQLVPPASCVRPGRKAVQGRASIGSCRRVLRMEEDFVAIGGGECCLEGVNGVQ